MAIKAAAKPRSGKQAPKLKCSPQEWAVREDLAAAFRLSALQGWDELLFAHISARVPGEPNHTLMHPASLLFEEITASRLHKLDENCQHLVPSTEPAHAFAFPAHKAVYEEIPECNCVLHLHTKSGTAVAMQQQGIVPGNQYALFLGPIRYHDYEGLLSSAEEGRRLARNFKGSQVMIQRSHGFMVWGRSVREAYMIAFILNRACEVQLAAMSDGAKPYIPPKAVQAKTLKEGNIIISDNSPFVQMNWRALKRKLDREAPDYKT